MRDWKGRRKAVARSPGDQHRATGILLLISLLTAQMPWLRVLLLGKTTSFSLGPSRHTCVGLWNGHIFLADCVTRVKCESEVQSILTGPTMTLWIPVGSSGFLSVPCFLCLGGAFIHVSLFCWSTTSGQQPSTDFFSVALCSP